MLAHELVFGAFVALTGLRLALVAGPLDGCTLVFAGLLAGQAAAMRARWSLRLFWFPLAMNVAYVALGPAMERIQPGKADGLLIGLDGFLVGGNLSRLLQHVSSPALTEVMTVAYVLFFPYLLLSLIHHARRDLETAKRLFAGAFTVYGVGFLCYTLLPARGPWMAMSFDVPLRGGPLFRLHDWIVTNGTNGVDVFPSLHCALTAFLLFFDRVHDPARYRRWLAPVVVLWTSTLYLRYHYFVDVLAGFALAAGALALVGALPRLGARRVIPSAP